MSVCQVKILSACVIAWCQEYACRQADMHLQQSSPFEFSLFSLLFLLPLPFGCSLGFLLGFCLHCFHLGAGFYGQQLGALLLQSPAGLPTTTHNAVQSI